MKYYMRGIGVGILVCALILIISRINTPAEISDSEIVSRALALGMIDPGNMSISDAAASESGEGQVSDLNNPAGIQVIVDDDVITDTEGDNGEYVSPVVIDDRDTIGQPPVSQQDAREAQDDNTGYADDSKPETDQQNESDTRQDDPAQTEKDDKQDDSVRPDTDTQNDNSQENKPSGNTGSAGTVSLEVYRGNSSDVVASRAQSLGLVDDAADFDRFLVNNGYANRISVGTFNIEKGSDYNMIAKIITNSK